MNIEQHKAWVIEFYRNRDWLQLSSDRRLNFLTEEVGELSQAIRQFEYGRDHPGDKVVSKQTEKDHIVEELADVMDEVLIFCDKYDISVQDLLDYSEAKLAKRFKTE